MVTWLQMLFNYRQVRHLIHILHDPGSEEGQVHHELRLAGPKPVAEKLPKLFWFIYLESMGVCSSLFLLYHH